MVIICERCNQTFITQARLEKHNLRATNNVCTDCPYTFCNEMLLERHRRRVHSGDGQVFQDYGVNGVIVPGSGHIQTSEYQDVITDHYDKICTFTKEQGDKKTINTQISPAFTYTDLKNLFMRIRNEEKSAFKITIGFGSVLYDAINKTYRYFYVSNNQLLFDTAFTISTYGDMDNFFDKIVHVWLDSFCTKWLNGLKKLLELKINGCCHKWI